MHLRADIKTPIYCGRLRNPWAAFSGSRCGIGILSVSFRHASGHFAPAALPPNFSLDLEKLSERHKKVMRAWMRFFKHIKDLYGTFNFEPQDASMTVFQRWNDDKAHITLLYAGAREITWLDRPAVFVSNATEHADVYVKGIPKGEFTVRYYDHLLHLKKKVDVNIARSGKIPTVAGGLVVVTRKGVEPSWAPEYDR